MTDSSRAMPPPAPARLSSGMTFQFRGRIFHPDEGYTPRSLLELRIRAGIGAILNKRDWWVKWRRNDGAIRERWFAEFERGLLMQTLSSSTSDWSIWTLDEAVVARYAKFPQDGTDDEKRAFVETVCATVEYNLIWNESWWDAHGENDAEDEHESPEEFQEGNERMESYGQITWYFELVLLNERVRTGVTSEANWMPPRVFELGTSEGVAKASEFLLAVHAGEVTKDSFAAYCPEGDLRPQIVDALWFHVYRIMNELDEIRRCMTKTIEKVIENNKLDVDGEVTEFLSPGPVQETWMSDVAIKAELKQKFISEVAVLENVPDDEKDWHPHSNNQVLDLLHPSLYCCVLDETKQASVKWLDAFNRNGDLAQRMQRLAFAPCQVAKNPYRGQAEFQWIPSDFHIGPRNDVQIMSYINNLHPVKHRAMYDSIAAIFKHFVPMFDRVLSCLLNQDGPLPTIEIPDLDNRSTQEVPQHPPIPEILRLHPPGTPFSLRDRVVQVVVKIAEIHLTPEKPSYPGGSWHVEGSDAEQLVATGIYYFGCENITESKLAFRVIVSEPDYQQDDTLGMMAVYGLARDERLVQNLGVVTAEEGRCVVFPNTLQHRVEPFELEDKTKPGVRKILAFFLVDPSKYIPSTFAIPPQQETWLSEIRSEMVAPLSMLPDAVVNNNLTEMLGSGMTLTEAKQHRLRLMDERQPSADGDDDDYELFFSLCEH